jgi:hypothetical protein
MGILIALYCWAILAFSRIVGPPPDAEPTRRYFARIGIKVTEGSNPCA